MWGREVYKVCVRGVGVVSMGDGQNCPSVCVCGVQMGGRGVYGGIGSVWEGRLCMCTCVCVHVPTVQGGGNTCSHSLCASIWKEVELKAPPRNIPFFGVISLPQFLF